MTLGLFSFVGCGGGEGRGTSAGTGIDTGIDSGVDTGVDGETGGEDGDSQTNTGDGDGDGDTGDNSEGGEFKWDVLGVPDGGDACGGGGGGNDPTFSYLWAANSTQGTISKINTKTVTEEGRYIVRPDGAGSPSRTSVSLAGNVAVASRSGGVTKIYANPEDCQESNGMPGIQTSNSNQYLAWGEEECVAWHTPFGYASQRPVAWGAGTFNNGNCAYEEVELWTSGNNGGGSLDVIVLDGDDGSVVEMVEIPTGGGNLNSDFYGIYGGAVDGDGNFWGSQLGASGQLVRVFREDMTYEIYHPPGGPHYYGMTVDSEGYVWLCASVVTRYDPQNDAWATAQTGGNSGCMAEAGPDGLLWMAGGGGVIGVNRESLAVEKNWPSNGSYGVSIDFEGYVWAVAYGSNATKVDPDTGELWTYSGLVGAYTYSDMTGYALSNAGIPNG
ncbi:hypothetical protein [Enhygromyxa salina]|uniref:hypothetical protein n=1 Tax=Enhygromyxa salina TaxID=215803 RepID=UPI0015E5D328|nr:hypothetical protein [Enhygromyxa salina]